MSEDDSLTTVNEKERPQDVVEQLAVSLVENLANDGTWDAVRVAVIKGGLKVEISVGWPDEDDDDEEEYDYSD